MTKPNLVDMKGKYIYNNNIHARNKNRNTYEYYISSFIYIQ